MSQAPSASIIIPTWNGLGYIEDCLKSLATQDYPNFNLIVVDNASQDGTPNWVAEHFPNITLIRNEQNLGFAGGVNVGLKAADGEIIALFNQDAIAQTGWLAALVQGILATPDIGIAGCKILDMDAPTLQHAGGYLNLPLALSSHFGMGEIDTGQFDEVKEVDFVTGAAIALRREVLETVGYFDETLFFYFEDVDYCYRARAAGFRVVYVPSAVLQHHSNTSLGSETVDHFRRFHASRLCFVLKHWGLEYFTSEVYPAEYSRLDLISLKEGVGLRHAYQLALEYIIRNRQTFALNDEGLARLFSIFRNLRQKIPAAYRPHTQPLPEFSPTFQNMPGNWWNVQEHPFVSHIPLVGSLIAWFRTQWNNIATKWFVHAILRQQNTVNWQLVQNLEIVVQNLERQSQFVGNQNQIVERHTDLLNDFDDDQTRLTMKLSKILYRLDRIEAQLAEMRKE